MCFVLNLYSKQLCLLETSSRNCARLMVGSLREAIALPPIAVVKVYDALYKEFPGSVAPTPWPKS